MHRTLQKRKRDYLKETPEPKKQCSTKASSGTDETSASFKSRRSRSKAQSATLDAEKHPEETARAEASQELSLRRPTQKAENHRASCAEKDHEEAAKRKLLEAWERFQEEQPNRQICCEVDVATLMDSERAVGRDIRVYWPEEDAWFLGSITSYDPATGQHQARKYPKIARHPIFRRKPLLRGFRPHMSYGEKCVLHEPVERIRMVLGVAERPEPPGAKHLHSLANLLACQAEGMRHSKDSAAAENAQKARALAFCASRLEQAAEEAAATEEAATSSEPPPLPGEVVWAKAKRWPHWPALVASKEEASAHGVKGVGKGVYVQFFGEATWGFARRGDVVPFLEGIERGLFRKQKRISFQTAIFEMLTYLQDGELPETMIPDNNDTGFSSDDEEDIKAQEEFDDEANQEIDWPVSSNLTVHKLGRIEYVHPGFHNEKHIWPLGFRSACVASSPASRNFPAQHICEILAAPNGSGPLFRISCCGEAAESRVSPQRAWQKLHGDERHCRRTGIDGLQLFGMKSARVLNRIQQLPNADRLERFCCWTNGRKPALPKLTVSERRARIKAEVEMQQLPEGVAPVAPVPLEGLRCEACGGDEESEDDVLLQCDGPCRAFVHQECCGILDRPKGAWVCALCRTGCTNPPACVLCTTTGGQLTRTRCGRWCHAACALWIPEAFIDTGAGPEPLVDISRVPKARRQLSCSICKQSYGACIQCGNKSCCVSFHPLCARAADLTMDCVHDELFSIDEPGQRPTAAHATSIVAGTSSTALLAAPKRRRSESNAEGTAVGDGTRLVCYCKRHGRRSASRQQGPKRTATPPVGQTGPSIRGEAPVERECSRFVAFNHALRRGQRAPEAAAAAAAKRSFLQPAAYKVTELPPRPGARGVPQSRCLDKEGGDNRFTASWSSPAAGWRAGGKGVKSISDRYWQMRATEHKRVAFGKSVIHGWGALSKVHHAKDEMVIEYSGELIRPSVADIRERQLYDKLVGAGTYVFRMNDELCVDATRAGNLAHMLNHSCQPNCFSRTIQVTSRTGELEEHVVIVAKEDIAAGLELTYDYRYSSSEVLPCNCGAPDCCGLVNESGAAEREYLLIPRAQLKPL